MSLEEYGMWDGLHGIPGKRGSLLPRDRDKYGHRSWDVTTVPVIEPVAVDDVKDLGRIDGDDEDGMIRAWITGVRRRAEGLMGRALITQSLTMLMDFWPGEVIELPRPPLQTITSVATIDEDDAVITTYAEATYYYPVTNSEPGKLIWRQGMSLPVNTQRDYQGFRIIWVAGYGDTAVDVPQDMRDAIAYWVLALYEGRVPDLKSPPPQVKVLLDSIPRI